MAEVDVRDASATKLGSVALDDSVFGVKPNVAVMHQVVTAQLAGIRSGTQSTLTRSEVRGGGRKPWRQKGSGKARQGSIRAPHWRGGGVALGPKPRSYAQRTPKKMVQLALRSALSDRAAMGRVAVVDAWTFDKASTKAAKAALSALAIEGKALVVLSRDDKVALLSFRNLPEVHVILDSELNAYDVLCSDWVVFTRASLPTAPAPKSDAAPKSDSAPAPKSDAAPAAPADSPEEGE